GAPTPHGFIETTGDNVVFPAGRAGPLKINKTTGKLLPYYPGVKDHGGGGSVRISVYDDYLTMGGFVFSLKNFLPLSFNDKAKFLKPFSALSLIDQEVLYSVSEQQFTAFS
ncbi:MAG: hypothetical protein P1V19_23630, partial [Gimesia sp.]|nr:hypothetical protein [Gimesia sp.]